MNSKLAFPDAWHSFTSSDSNVCIRATELSSQTTVLLQIKSKHSPFGVQLDSVEYIPVSTFKLL